jgi:hypothetical protein
VLRRGWSMLALPATRLLRARLPFALVALALAGVVAAWPDPEGALARPRRPAKAGDAGDGDEPAEEASNGKGKGKPRGKARKAAQCRPQKAQKFLVRSTFVVNNQLLPAAHARAVKYRTEQYGYVEGFGSSKWNPHPPTFYGEATSFFGHPLRVHRRIVPALRCVEEELPRACRKSPYTAASVGGFRDHNSYRGGEITNHLYGIAIDIDPERNPCCHCVEPWGSHPRCQGEARSAYERMAMPACWVETFEKYGFYWLGHDRLQDTMHFEFLGKPDRILR